MTSTDDGDANEYSPLLPKPMRRYRVEIKRRNGSIAVRYIQGTDPDDVCLVLAGEQSCGVKILHLHEVDDQ